MIVQYNYLCLFLQLFSEKISGVEGTKLDDEFLDMERKIDITNKAVAEILSKATEYLQPNPAYRAKLGMLNTVSKIRGQVKTTGYPQTEGLLGDCMLKYGKELGEGSTFGNALIEVGESMKLMAEVKDSLDINVKQTFIDPLQLLQDKDLKEIGASPPLGPRVHYPHLLGAFATSSILSPESPFFPFLSIGFFGLTFKHVSTAALDSWLHISAPPVHSPHHSQSLPKHHLKKLEGRRLDYDYKKKRVGKIPDEEVRQAVEKFEESKELAERSMFNFLENDVEQVSQLAVFIEAALDYHRQSTEILQELQSKLQMRISAASNIPKREYKPRPIKRSPSELNGVSTTSSAKTTGEMTI
ncbi:hypothetical protein J1605_017102, partial [Eschrichtius robustus]